MRSRCPPEYQIPDDPDSNKMDAAYLRTCLGIRTVPGETPIPLPVAVRRAHYDMARALSLLGAVGPTGMDATQLAIVVALALRDPEMEIPRKAPEPVEPDGPEIIDAAALESGQKVVVLWQEKEQPAHFIKRGPGGRLQILVNGDERFFKPEAVRLPQPGEWPGVAENINQPAEV